MNQARKTRLIIMVLCLLLVVAAYFALSRKQENEEETEPEVYAVINIDTDNVTEIGIINSDSTTNLILKEGQWKLLEDDTIAIDSTSVDSYLKAAGSITSEIMIEDVEDFEQYGLEEPILNITLQWDSNMYNLKVGDYNSMISGYYIRVNDASTVYTVSSSVYYSLNKSLEDFEAIVTEEEE